MPLLSSFALVVLAMLTSTGAAGLRQPTPEPSARDIADRLQKKYDSVRDFSADFSHRHEGGTLRRIRQERGTLLVKKPGKMRWTYKEPEEKTFVSNGVRLYQHLPLDNRVIVSDAPGDDQPAMVFLAGKGDLNRDFTVSFAKGGAADVWALRLDPRQPQDAFDWIELLADRKTLQLRGMVVAEKQGSRSTFAFSNFKENPGLADKLFEFTMPKGVEITNAVKH
jgi:outer membrane lipoprotein carrier protein